MNKPLNDRYVSPEPNRLIIKSYRAVNRWVSYDVINIYEDAFVKIDSSISISNIDKISYFIRRVLKNHYLCSNKFTDSIYRIIQRVLSKTYNESIFVTCMSAPLVDILGFYKSKGIKIAYIIDAWENSIEYIAAHIESIDIVLMAYQDSINFLKKYLPSHLAKKIYLFPSFIDSNVYPKKVSDKIYDIIQVGRKNNTLHEWTKRYSAEKKYSYLYQKRNKRGMYYFEDREWEGNNFQLSYPSLVKTLSQSKIALVSPSDTTDIKRTGRVSPLTHRYLEAAMCYAVLVGLAPTGGEYVNFFPKTFTTVPKNYEEFKDVCNRLIEDEDLRLKITKENRNYVTENHSVEVRYKQLQQILSNYKKS